MQNYQSTLCTIICHYFECRQKARNAKKKKPLGKICFQQQIFDAWTDEICPPDISSKPLVHL